MSPRLGSKAFSSCFLQPLDRPMPMVATADVGRVAAELLLQDWSGKRVVELEGPYWVTQNEIASELAKAAASPGSRGSGPP